MSDVRPFEEYKEMIQDMRKEEMIKGLYDLSARVIKQENIIKEVREWAKKCSCQFTNDDGELVVSEISFNIQARPCDLFKILDKEVN